MHHTVYRTWLVTMLCVTLILMAPYTSGFTFRASGNAEVELVGSVLSSYTDAMKRVVPTMSSKNRLDLGVGLSATQITSFDRENNILSLHGYLQMTWNDVNIQWTPAAHGGVTSIRLRPSDIWTPDLQIFNSADTDLQLSQDTRVVINSDGAVTWVPIINIRVGCSSDSAGTTLTCPIKLGSWTYSGAQLNTDFSGAAAIDVSYMIPSGHYDVISHDAERHVVTYPGVDEPYIDLTFTLVLREKEDKE